MAIEEIITESESADDVADRHTITILYKIYFVHQYVCAITERIQGMIQSARHCIHYSKLNTLPADASCLRFDDGLTTATARLKVRWFATPFL